MADLLPPDEEIDVETIETTQAWIKRYIEYNPITGEFKRINLNSNSYLEPCGFYQDKKKLTLYTSIEGKNKSASHVAYCYMTGHWPTRFELIVYLDGDKTNLRFNNLELTTRSKVNHRSKIVVDNLGVKQLPSGKYQAKIHVSNKAKCLGSYPTAQQARVAYLKAKVKIVGMQC